MVFRILAKCGIIISKKVQLETGSQLAHTGSLGALFSSHMKPHVMTILTGFFKLYSKINKLNTGATNHHNNDNFQVSNDKKASTSPVSEPV